MREKQDITIKIADVAPISLTINRETEEWVREAERNVNQVWQKWRSDFEKKSSKEVLAMVAFQFAKLYYQLLHNVNREQLLLADFENQLNNLLQISPETSDEAHQD